MEDRLESWQAQMKNTITDEFYKCLSSTTCIWSQQDWVQTRKYLNPLHCTLWYMSLHAWEYRGAICYWKCLIWFYSSTLIGADNSCDFNGMSTIFSGIFLGSWQPAKPCNKIFKWNVMSFSSCNYCLCYVHVHVWLWEWYSGQSQAGFCFRPVHKFCMGLHRATRATRALNTTIGNIRQGLQSSNAHHP